MRASSRDTVDMKTLMLMGGYRWLSKDEMAFHIATLERAVVFYTLYINSREKGLPSKYKKALAIVLEKEYNGSIEDRFKPWLREIMFKSHPKPQSDEQSELFEALKHYKGESE